MRYQPVHGHRCRPATDPVASNRRPSAEPRRQSPPRTNDAINRRLRRLTTTYKRLQKITTPIPSRRPRWLRGAVSVPTAVSRRFLRLPPYVSWSWPGRCRRGGRIWPRPLATCERWGERLWSRTPRCRCGPEHRAVAVAPNAALLGASLRATKTSVSGRGWACRAFSTVSTESEPAGVPVVGRAYPECALAYGHLGGAIWGPSPGRIRPLDASPGTALFRISLPGAPTVNGREYPGERTPFRANFTSAERNGKLSGNAFVPFRRAGTAGIERCGTVETAASLY